MLQKWGSLSVFSLQALENSNGQHENWQPNSTNGGVGIPLNMQILRKSLSINQIILWCIENRSSTNPIISRACALVLSLCSIFPKVQHFDAYNYANSTFEERKRAEEEFTKKEKEEKNNKIRAEKQSTFNNEQQNVEDMNWLEEEYEDENDCQYETEKSLRKKVKNPVYKHTDILEKIIQYSFAGNCKILEL